MNVYANTSAKESAKIFCHAKNETYHEQQASQLHPSFCSSDEYSKSSKTFFVGINRYEITQSSRDLKT